LGQSSRPTLRLAPKTMVLKVRLILGLVILEVLGRLGCQKVWVVPFMTRRLPFSSWIEIEGLSPLRLWRRENFLSAPRLREPIAVFCPSAFSSSLERSVLAEGGVVLGIRLVRCQRDRLAGRRSAGLDYKKKTQDARAARSTAAVFTAIISPEVELMGEPVRADEGAVIADLDF
jgi:hypothetical protein